jgi:hypothetical protein
MQYPAIEKKEENVYGSAVLPSLATNRMASKLPDRFE